MGAVVHNVPLLWILIGVIDCYLDFLEQQAYFPFSVFLSFLNVTVADSALRLLKAVTAEVLEVLAMWEVQSKLSFGRMTFI